MTTQVHRECNKRWYQKTRPTRIAKAKVWNKAHPEKCREYRRKWLENGGKEYMAAYMREWRAERKALT